MKQDGIHQREWGTEIVAAHVTFDVERLVRSKLGVTAQQSFDPDIFTYEAVKGALETLHLQVDKSDEAIMDDMFRLRVDPKTGHRGLLLELEKKRMLLREAIADHTFRWITHRCVFKGFKSLVQFDRGSQMDIPRGLERELPQSGSWLGQGTPVSAGQTKAAAAAAESWQ